MVINIPHHVDPQNLEKQRISAFFDLKTSAVQLKKRAGFLFNLYFIRLIGNQSKNYRIDHGA